MAKKLTELKMPIGIVTRADIVIVDGEVLKNRYGNEFKVPAEYLTGEIAIWGINVIYDSNRTCPKDSSNE